jgi:2-dehydro-3-deoxyphosphogluconate aldolase / (4S)-4-hydroxy-2-oxoglutarate aldolase
VLAAVAERHSDAVLLGAGTLRTPAQAGEAVAAGARFLVAPGLDDELVAAMRATGVVTMAGALTPTEVMRAQALEVDVVKVFPAALGGPAYVRALRGPFPDVPFMPTGGVSAANLREWLDAGVVAVGAGGELCSTADIADGRFEAIETNARAFAGVPA